MLISIIALAIQSVAGPTAPPQASPSGHPAPAFALEASFRYHCPTREVTFSISQQGDSMRIVAMDIGDASTAENIQTINQSLQELAFDRPFVSCTGLNGITIQFTGLRDSGADELSSEGVILQSPAADQATVTIRNSWTEAD